MDQSQGSDSCQPPGLRSDDPKRLVARTEFSVFTRAECSQAWSIYSDWTQWRNFSDIYGERLEWRGTPWQPGSRLLVDLAKPVPLSHESELMAYIVPRCVAWLSQTDEYRIEQWVLFYPYNGGGTRITAWAEFSGDVAFVGGLDARQALQDMLTAWFAAFCRYCNLIVDGTNR